MDEIICSRCQRGEYCPENEELMLKKRRPLLGQIMPIVEFEGSDVLGYHVLGHVDKDDFVLEMFEENTMLCDKENVTHTYARYVPVRDLDDMIMIFTSKPARGAFKITHIDAYNAIYIIKDE